MFILPTKTVVVVTNFFVLIIDTVVANVILICVDGTTTRMLSSMRVGRIASMSADVCVFATFLTLIHIAKAVHWVFVINIVGVVVLFCFMVIRRRDSLANDGPVNIRSLSTFVRMYVGDETARYMRAICVMFGWVIDMRRILFITFRRLLALRWFVASGFHHCAAPWRSNTSDAAMPLHNGIYVVRDIF